MSNLKATTLMLAGILAMDPMNHPYTAPSGPKPWKPEFTPEEIEYLGTLAGKEKKKVVAALRKKYLAEKNGVLLVEGSSDGAMQLLRAHRLVRERVGFE